MTTLQKLQKLALYFNMSEVSREIGIERTNLSNRIKGKSKHGLSESEVERVSVFLAKISDIIHDR